MIQDKEMDDEANLFALLLLMPKKFFEEDIKQSFDLTDDTQIKELCRKYQVSISMFIKRVEIYNSLNM